MIAHTQSRITARITLCSHAMQLCWPCNNMLEGGSSTTCFGVYSIFLLNQTPAFWPFYVLKVCLPLWNDLVVLPCQIISGCTDREMQGLFMANQGSVCSWPHWTAMFDLQRASGQMVWQCQAVSSISRVALRLEPGYSHWPWLHGFLPMLLCSTEWDGWWRRLDMSLETSSADRCNTKVNQAPW